MFGWACKKSFLSFVLWANSKALFSQFCYTTLLKGLFQKKKLKFPFRRSTPQPTSRFKSVFLFLQVANETTTAGFVGMQFFFLFLIISPPSFPLSLSLSHTIKH
eukprot:TRINITY_DN18187_c2_g1_i1.p1 TRINITY_DN18187_c2_g1~~TRINITY_DN18187_c2_g1_i1.p1  ORF type:complete len:104 (-),score=7.05 TRINITY_DN18187_c2_g1_i1:1011-1322(-)